MSDDDILMPPNSTEAEEAVLGSILINPEVLHDVAAFLKPDDFYILGHNWIYAAMLAIRQRNEPVEYLTLTNELKARKQLDEVGNDVTRGAAYITYLISNTPTSIHAPVYAQMVYRTAARRNLLKVCSDIANLARQEDIDINEVNRQAEEKMFSATQRRKSGKMVSLAEAMSQHFDKITTLLNSDSEITGIPSGLTDIDRLLGGFQDSDFIVIASRPGVGKTSLMLNIALHAAKNEHKKIALFSLEMGLEQLCHRFSALETGIDSGKFRSGNLQEHEVQLYSAAYGQLQKYPIFIDDTAGLDIHAVASACRRLKRAHGLDLVIIDYLQLMLTDRRAENRNAAITLISQVTKNLARELNVPVLAGSQLSRECEKRTNKRPVLSDLRESGSIEQDADIVAFIYRDDMYKPENKTPDNKAEIMIAKHRNGPTGLVTLYFDKQLTQFRNLKKANGNEQN